MCTDNMGVCVELKSAKSKCLWCLSSLRDEVCFS